MTKPVMEIRDLRKNYGNTTALDGLTFSINAGETVCLLGANGAGKTTTLNLILGFSRPSAGDILVAGQPIHDSIAATRARLGYVPEVVALYPLLTGAENLNFFHALSGRPALSPGERDDILRRLNFPANAIDRRLDTYSKGMRQKIGLAIAIAKHAEGILLDEPLSGLDPASANDLVGILKLLAKSGTAILVSTHDIFRAAEIASRIGIMRHGRLVEWVDPARLSAREIETIYLAHMAERAN